MFTHTHTLHILQSQEVERDGENGWPRTRTPPRPQKLLPVEQDSGIWETGSCGEQQKSRQTEVLRVSIDRGSETRWVN